MPATLSTVSRRWFRVSRSVLNPHLSLNRNPKAASEETERQMSQMGDTGKIDKGRQWWRRKLKKSSGG